VSATAPGIRRPTALIAEDEAILRDQLRRLLTRLWPDLDIVAEAGDGLEALVAVEQRLPDIVFLDIEMPGLTGLQLARHVQGRCHVVFVTAYEAHAVAAFEQGAADYVLKPFEPARLALALERLKERLASPPRSLSGVVAELASVVPRRDYLRWINAGERESVRLIPVDHVQYFQADVGYTRVVTADAEALISRSLRELGDQLDPDRFWTVHRSTIVNADAIAGVSRNLRGRMFLKLKTRSEKLAVSEAHEHLFRRM
jgi:DNA-binding LytR/AlgR family response regulator